MPRTTPKPPTLFWIPILAILVIACGGPSNGEPTPRVVSVEINQSDQTIPQGQSLPLTASVQVTAGASQDLNWSATCGTIQGTGHTITYQAPTEPGTCTVTARSTHDTSKSASIDITIEPGDDHEPSIISVEIQPPGPLELQPGNTTTLTANVSADPGADTTVAWSSDDEDVAEVDADGVVTASASGTTSITARSIADTTKSDTVTVVVTSPAPAQILHAAGDQQTAEVNTPVQVPPAVTVLDSSGTPLAGIEVQFDIIDGDGSTMPSHGRATSDQNGNASLTAWILGPTAGINTLRASIPGTTPLLHVDFVATATPMPTTVTLHLLGGSNHDVYLGCLTCSAWHADSVHNEFGQYGSRFSSTSIFNNFGTYGSPYSNESACNTFATSPPGVYDEDSAYYGELTLNQYRVDAIRDPAVLDWLQNTVCE